MTRMLLALSAVVYLLTACGPKIEEYEFWIDDKTVYYCKDLTVTDCGLNFTNCKDGSEPKCVPNPYVTPSPKPTVTPIVIVNSSEK